MDQALTPPQEETPAVRALGAALAALLLLAGCRLLSGGFDTAAGGPPRTALVAVDNPFWPPEMAPCDR